jgi:putative ABC transport system permease protein
VNAGVGALSESFVQLRSSPLRTLLTLLGVVFGVGSVVAMVSIGEGAQRKILASIEAMGATTLHVRASVAKDQSLADLVNVSVGLSQSDARALARSLGATGAVAWRAAYAPKVTTLVDPPSELKVVGVTSSLFEAARLEIAAGRRFSTADETAAAAYAIVGDELASQSFPEGAVGRWVRVDYAWFQVVGVLAPRAPAGAEGDGEANLDRSILVPFASLRELLEPPRAYGDLDGISVQLATIDDTRGGKIVAERLLSSLHGGATDFAVLSPDEILRQRRETQAVMTAVLTAIAAISLLVGGIGVMNIMLANVSERVLEIGLRRAIGATQRDVMLQFLLEATVICVVGGAIGAVLGVLAALGASWVMELPIVLSWQALVLAFAISVLVGVVSGFIPARRAAELDPIAALRGE